MIKEKDSIYGNTDTGRLRDNNEDAFVAYHTADNRYMIAAVIDGVGGYEGGEVAASIAQNVLSNNLKKIGNDPLDQMKTSIYEINELIISERNKNKKLDRMACVLTISIADLSENTFYYAHVGDTRLYLYRDQSLVKVTKDHSFVGFLEDSKRISEDQAMVHPKRNEINKALGFEPNIQVINDYVETGISPFLPGDVLLLCSDGLSDMLDRTVISNVLGQTSSLEKKVQNLIEKANEAGGKDNITVILLSNNNQAREQVVTKPVPLNRQEQVSEENEQLPVASGLSRKRKNKLPIISSILILLVVSGVVYFIWNKNKSYSNNPSDPILNRVLSKEQKKLIDSLQQHQNLTLPDSIYSSTIPINDTITLNHDSVNIIGNGIVLKADSSFNGPAFYIPSSNRFTVLEGITFENFKIAINSAHNKIILKNVRFVNCKIPFSYDPSSSDSFIINGFIGDSLFQFDSISKRPSRRHEQH